MKFCLIASGSSGNCAVVHAGGTTVLLDAGISLRRVRRGLQMMGLDPQRVRVGALLISHEHSDHCREAAMYARRLGCPIYASEGTLSALVPYLNGAEKLVPLRMGRRLAIQDLEVLPFRVPHDAVDPCGFTLSDGRRKLGVATDLGAFTPELREHLKGCQALALEANHDLEMLLNGPYPWHLKQRIQSELGHLSNDEAGQALAALALGGGLERAVLAHLSEHNNRPDLALSTVARYLETFEVELDVRLSHARRPSDTLSW